MNRACALPDPADPADIPEMGVCSNATTTIVPNLEIVKLDRPDPVGTGDLLLYTIRVTDVGGGGATGVNVTDIINFDDVDFVEVEGGSFDCSRVADRIDCTNGEILAGESDTVELNVRPRREGTLENAATVDVGGFVIDEATTTTTVEGDAPGDGPGDGPGDDGPGDDGPGDDGPGDDGPGDLGDDFDDAGNADDQYARSITNIINIPDKGLPKTGGPPLLGILFLVVAGAGLLTAVVRRR